MDLHSQTRYLTKNPNPLERSLKRKSTEAIFFSWKKNEILEPEIFDLEISFFPAKKIASPDFFFQWWKYFWSWNLIFSCEKNRFARFFFQRFCRRLWIFFQTLSFDLLNSCSKNRISTLFRPQNIFRFFYVFRGLKTVIILKKLNIDIFQIF